MFACLLPPFSWATNTACAQQMFIKLKMEKRIVLLNISLFCLIDTIYPVSKFQHETLTLVNKREPQLATRKASCKIEN